MSKLHYTGLYMVMSATIIDSRSSNRDRCFPKNAVGFLTEAEAVKEAKRRNKEERKAGHTNVNWYPAPQFEVR